MNRAWFVVVGLAVGLTGCVGSQSGPTVGRSQIGEDPPAEPDALATVGSKTTVGNTEPIPVSGVGLVYRLQPGTGSSAPPGGWRQMLEHNLRKDRYTGVKELLDDPNQTTSLVLVSALIPAGARKGDPIDVQITLPDESKTRSLKGGYLLTCNLVNYDTTGNLKSVVNEGRMSGPSGGIVLGSALAQAEGPLTAGVFIPAGGKASTAGEGEYRVARVWGGAKVTESRPYFLMMNPGENTIRTAAAVAERLNATFHATADPNNKVARFQSKDLVLVNVPTAYRHNHFRFLLVARQVPIQPVGSDHPYRRKLEEELLDPATALTAAIKLEALGGDARQALRLGLESPSPWVRFAAAEALAYLGQSDGAGELAKLAEKYPALRAHCLKALASLDDAASTDRLADLMASSDAELRYGAFIALRLADPAHLAIKGLQMNKSYTLHRVAAGSPGLVHVASERRSEIVLFGDGHTFNEPFTLPVGTDFSVSLPTGEAEVTVTRIVRGKDGFEEKKQKCPADVAAVLISLARLGASYTEAIDFVRRVDRAGVLACRVASDAIPRELGVQQLAVLAPKDPDLAKANVEVARVGTTGPDLTTVGLDITPEADANNPVAEQPAGRAPLSRDPGRIFAPRKPPEPTVPDTLTPVVPASATEPAPAADSMPLSRNPGTLFGPRK